jgi:hypothetical protein
VGGKTLRLCAARHDCNVAVVDGISAQSILLRKPIWVCTAAIEVLIEPIAKRQRVHQMLGKYI